jgi:hypothetical protein
MINFCKCVRDRVASVMNEWIICIREHTLGLCIRNLYNAVMYLPYEVHKDFSFHLGNTILPSMQTGHE